MTGAELRRVAGEIFQQVMDDDIDGANRTLEDMVSRLEFGQDYAYWIAENAARLAALVGGICE
jgi:hypothetical protein